MPIHDVVAVTGNLLTDFPDLMPLAVAACVGDPAPVTGDPAAFAPGFELPELTDDVRAFYSAATVRWQRSTSTGAIG